MVTPLYAALIAILFIGLSFRTLTLRRRLGVAIGTGDNLALERAIAAHANCAEYVPIALLMLFFLEQLTGSATTVHVLGIALVTGRVVHAYAVSQVNEDIRLRVLGMVLTLGCLISATLRVLTHYLN